MTYVLTGETLTAQKVFTSLSLFNSVRIVMALFFPIAITLMNEGRVSIERIQVSVLITEWSLSGLYDNLEWRGSLALRSLYKHNSNANWKTTPYFSFISRSVNLVSVLV